MDKNYLIMKKTYYFFIIIISSVLFVNQAKSACTANFTYTNVANVFNFTDASSSQMEEEAIQAGGKSAAALKGSTKKP